MNCTHPDCPPARKNTTRPYQAAYRVVLYLAVPGCSCALMVASEHQVCRWHRYERVHSRGGQGTRLSDLYGPPAKAAVVAELGLDVDWERSYLSYEPLGV